MSCLGRGGNDQKFLGEGQSFKGKLIGVLEVAEARGDRMCQVSIYHFEKSTLFSNKHTQENNPMCPHASSTFTPFNIIIMMFDEAL